MKNYPKAIFPLYKRMVLDRRAMAEQYQEMIESGFCSNQADITQHCGVSQAWVISVMNTLQ
jgi:hypothetical protein